MFFLSEFTVTSVQNLDIVTMRSGEICSGVEKYLFVLYLRLISLF